MSKIVLFNKPFNVLCQFTDEQKYRGIRQTLKDYVDIPNVYAAGRLDKDSEGLLLLTDDGVLQQKIANPKNKMAKTYCVQIEGIPDEDALLKLSQGVNLKDGLTKPAKVSLIAEPSFIEPRIPPIRFRKTVPESWLEITIREGKNRQIRRMCASVGYPVLRLIRVQVGDWTLEGIEQGRYKVLEK